MFAASPSHHSISEWRMQSIARDSDDSTDDEFFDAHGNNYRHTKIQISTFMNSSSELKRLIQFVKHAPLESGPTCPFGFRPF